VGAAIKEMAGLPPTPLIAHKTVNQRHQKRRAWLELTDFVWRKEACIQFLADNNV
jgi:hypothetical protein